MKWKSIATDGQGGTFVVPANEGVGSAVSVPTSSTDLVAKDSGKTVYLDAAEGFDISLPALAAGLKYKFVVALAFATTDFTIAASTNVIQGGAIVNSVYVPAVNENTISFVATAETVGDYVEVECDGTNWYVNGVGALAGSITFTAP